MSELHSSGTRPPHRPAPFAFPLEGHGPYVGLGGGHIRAGHLGEGARTPAEVAKALCSSATLPTLTRSLTGPQYESWFRSEFGCVSWSSFESIAAQLPSDQWSLHSPAAYYRNWPVDNVIQSFFGEQATGKTLDEVGEEAFKRSLYQSLIGQMLLMKGEIEGWRSTNVFGTLIWMCKYRQCAYSAVRHQ